jgi:hypothetical protein
VLNLSTPPSIIHMAAKTCKFPAFKKWACNYLEEHGKKLEIRPSTYVQAEGGRCAGFCDGAKVVVAGKNELFKEVFVHEFSHMTQVVEQSEIWDKNWDFWKILNHKKDFIPEWETILNIIELERDCEARALKFSRKWDLFDNEIYARQANVYLYYYQYVYLTRTWANTKCIYGPEVILMVPDKLVPLKNFNSINMGMMQAFHRQMTRKSIVS